MDEVKIGELARRTGLTVRTLHHYDAIGLVSPSRRTASGHRLYGQADIERLQRVLSLRQLGFSLEEIAETLRRPETTSLSVVELHLVRLRERIALEQRLCDRLEAIARRLRAAETVSADELLETMEAIVMFESYFTPEQQREIDERGKALGPEAIRGVEAEWPQLIARMRAEMESGADPASEAVQALARRWRELVEAFTGGNPEIERSVRTMYAQEPSVRARTGLDPEIMEYVARAMAAAKGG